MVKLKKQQSEVLVDLLIALFYVIGSFYLLSRFDLNLAIIVSGMLGLAIGYIRTGEQGAYVRKAALLSAFHLFLVPIMLFQWAHMLFFLVSFLTVYAGVVIQGRIAPSKKQYPYLGGVLALVFILSMTLPHLMTAQLSKTVNLHLPEYPLLTTDSTEVEVSTIQNNHPVLVMSFWTTWCAPCIEEMRYLQKHKSALSEDIRLVFVNVGSERETFENFMAFTDTSSFDFSFYYDPEQRYADALDVHTFPALLIGNGKQMLFRHQGFYAGENLIKYLNEKAREVKKY